MEGNILNVDKVKIYYPFLRDNRGMERSLLDEIQYLVGYLLIVDVIVIPPRELIGGTFGAKNIATASSSRLLNHLMSTGRIVTTSSSSDVRDEKDLIEHYSIEPIQGVAGLRIYERDSIIQKQSYISHLASHLEFAQYYSDSVKSDLRLFLSGLPDHPSVMRKIESINRELHPAEYQRLRLEAFHGYFSGGSIGNGAIMPCMYASDGKNSIYNPFYSKEAVARFSFKLQSFLKRELHKMPVHILDKIFDNLQIFKIRYVNLSKAYEKYYSKIAELLGKRSISIRLPTDILYVGVSLFIASMLSDVFTKEVFFGSVLAAYFAKGAYSYINRTMKITDYFTSKLESHFRFTGLYSEFRKDLVTLTEEFEASIEKAISH